MCAFVYSFFCMPAVLWSAALHSGVSRGRATTEEQHIATEIRAPGASRIMNTISCIFKFYSSARVLYRAADIFNYFSSFSLFALCVLLAWSRSLLIHLGTITAPCSAVFFIIVHCSPFLQKLLIIAHTKAHEMMKNVSIE